MRKPWALGLMASLLPCTPIPTQFCEFAQNIQREINV